MLVAIHQLHYLPWLRYFEKIARSDVLVVLDDAQFTKNDWQNRNKIKTAGGVAVLTLPVLHRLGQPLNAVQLDNRQPWRKKHARTLAQAYAAAPHYAELGAWLDAVYAREWVTMHALNRHMLEGFLARLGIDTPLHYASEMDVPGQATERLVRLVQAVGGTAYYTGAYATQVYLDPAPFRAAGIELVLQRWHAPVYPQLHGPFVPDLAIVDLLANCGAAARERLLAGGDDSA